MKRLHVVDNQNAMPAAATLVVSLYMVSLFTRPAAWWEWLAAIGGLLAAVAFWIFIYRLNQKEKRKGDRRP